MKKFFQEFKEFALRGNVMDLAVGVIIGAAFQAVVTSLTDNLLAPIIGLFTGNNLDYLTVQVFGAEFKYGAFLTSIINFVITAFVIFLLVRGMNRLAGFGKKKEEEAATTKKCPFCFTEIPLEATKCPNCTADLPDTGAEPAKT
ncbi:large conductance mechanosensitive channel protein MscL [Ruminococcaceae bacterium OttesenSCG-928-I18]|nr:large conductance mechanosensitive channel protein MscL [Ruminococcaceae bacterium OttesenSCG-928-I18]